MGSTLTEEEGLRHSLEFEALLNVGNDFVLALQQAAKDFWRVVVDLMLWCVAIYRQRHEVLCQYCAGALTPVHLQQRKHV